MDKNGAYLHAITLRSQKTIIATTVNYIQYAAYFINIKKMLVISIKLKNIASIFIVLYRFVYFFI